MLIKAKRNVSQCRENCSANSFRSTPVGARLKLKSNFKQSKTLLSSWRFDRSSALELPTKQISESVSLMNLLKVIPINVCNWRRPLSADSCSQKIEFSLKTNAIRRQIADIAWKVNYAELKIEARSVGRARAGQSVRSDSKRNDTDAALGTFSRSPERAIVGLPV